MDGVNDTGGSGYQSRPDAAWTVAELNQRIETVLGGASDRFPDYVVGEVTEIDHYEFGSFFELRDPENDCVVSCLVWSRTRSALDHDIEPGAKAVVGATVDFYAERGSCQLLVSECWPLGESERQQELDALRAELRRDGVLDDDGKQSVPPHPGCVGLVTSPSGSAREDTWAAVDERSPRTGVLLDGAPVQGADAVGSLIESLQSLDSHPEVETVVLTRGGGADADLWCFNAEPLVRAVADCATPVVAAIGHEDDETLVEDAADARAMTPTEAGIVVTTPTSDTMAQLAGVERRIDSSYRTLVAERLEQTERRVVTAYDSVTQQARQRETVRQQVHSLERRVTVAYRSLTETRLDTLKTRLDDAIHGVELAAESAVAEQRATKQRLSDLEDRIDTAYRALTTRQLQRSATRIETAHREHQTEARIAATTAETRRLRLIIAVLVTLILLGVAGLVAVTVL
jgi:exodeoxyribonuclease VII large subunit